jgi:hypothetical protein
MDAGLVRGSRPDPATCRGFRCQRREHHILVGTRERVRAAITAPTDEAARVLEQLRSASEVERLTIVIDGWCRGLAAGIEELAVSLDELQRRQRERAREADTATTEQPDATPPAEDASAEREGEPLDRDSTEGELAKHAKQSRAKTAALREESAAARDSGANHDGG